MSPPNKLENIDENGLETVANPTKNNPNYDHWDKNRKLYLDESLGRKFFLIADEMLIAATASQESIDKEISKREFDDYTIVKVTKYNPF